MKFIAIFLLLASSAFAQNLRVFFIDVEGGQATLFVTPKGDSLLIDTGWPGFNGRDADRIAATAKSAGLTRINTVLLTHYHIDHTGGVPQLVDRIPVGTFIDHGPNREEKDEVTAPVADAYAKVLASKKYKHIVAKPGQKLPIKGLEVEALTADGNLIQKPLKGAGKPNSYCAASEQRPADTSENGRSLGVLLTFHKTRILDLGDLTWDKEMQLMCPTNRIGKIDILVVSHHGWKESSSPALVHAIQPRLAIMDNGEKKGGSKPIVETVAKAPGLEGFWMLHYSEDAADESVAEKYLANLKGTDEGHNLELTVQPNGDFSVKNDRTNQTTTYPARQDKF